MSLHAARALSAQDWGPAAACLAQAGWRFAVDPDLTQAFLLHVWRQPPEPTPEVLAACLTEATGAPCAQRDAADDEERLLCTLAHLMRLGQWVELKVRKPWQTPSPTTTASPEDLEVAALWDGFLRAGRDGQRHYPAGVRPRWDALFLAEARGVFMAAARRPPEDFVESFFDVFLQGTPQVWRRVHARVVEQAPGGPIAALNAVLPREIWDQLAPAMVSGGKREASAMVAFPLRGELLRAHAARSVVLDHADGLDRLVDFHLAMRLVASWRAGRWSEDESIEFILRNHRRARGRLRAVVASLPEPPAVAAAGLHQRTRRAVLRFFGALGMEWGHGRSWHDAARVDVPCQLPPPLPPVPSVQDDILRTYLLRGLLLGHLDTLQRWIPTGNGGGRSNFYRYLNTLPAALDALAPAIGSSNKRDYQELRRLLRVQLKTLVGALEPTLQRLAALPTPTPSEAFEAALAAWHPAVPRLVPPFSGYVSTARQVIGQISFHRGEGI